MRQGRLLAVVAAGLSSLWSTAALAQASPSPFTYGTRYDAGRRVVGTISADPDWVLQGGPNSGLPYLAVRNTYDGAGRLTKVEQGSLSAWQSEAILPANWSGFSIYTVTDIAYDAMGRKVSEAVTPGSSAPNAGVTQKVTQYSYNNQGLLECTAVRMNLAAFGSLPGACSLGTQGSDGPDRITRNVYDAAGQLVTVQKAYGTSLQQDYATYTYSPNGKQTSVKDANGNLATMSYDGFDRQAAWYFPDKNNGAQASTTDYEAYGYDANGNRTSLRKRDGRTIGYGYDNLNRVTSKTYPNGGARGVYYSYDLAGHQTAARYDSASGGDAVISTWNGFGEQSSSTTNMAGTSRSVSYAIDANGMRTQLNYGDGNIVYYHRYDTGQLYYAELNGAVQLFNPPINEAARVYGLFRWNAAAAAWTNQKTLYVYDGIGRLSGFSHDLAGSGADASYTIAYNPASQMVTRTRDNDAYAFNGYVNVSRGYTRNGLNQYTAAGPASFTYDANGNLTSDGTSSYGYDIENRLVSASNGAQLTYDPTGRLWQTAGTSYGTTQFLYDGDALVAEYDGAGNMLKRYVHGDQDDDPLVQYSGSGTSSPAYLFADHQGSIVALTDGNGNVTAINRYDDYGIPGPGNTGRFQYTGQAWLPELGMYHYKARVYSPTLGRFLQTDPIGYDDQINLYAYVANDPVNKTDPTGERWEFLYRAYTRVRNDLSRAASDTRRALREAGNAVRNVPAVVGGSLREAAAQTGRAVREVYDPSSRPSGLGDLTRGEVAQIQRAVNEAGRPLDVVGSAATGDRRNPGTDLPVGKGPGTKSDIDYTMGPASVPYFKEGALPTPEILRGSPERGSPSIRFEPDERPRKVDN